MASSLSSLSLSSP
uniref:Uncharacterized protein n=1 Tax=Arundo donax TaxID=35708 RepID=A0A0A9E6S1_ARUDO